MVILFGHNFKHDYYSMVKMTGKSQNSAILYHLRNRMYFKDLLVEQIGPAS